MPRCIIRRQGWPSSGQPDATFDKHVRTALLAACLGLTVLFRSGANAAPVTVLETDFGDATVEVRNVDPGGQKSITGVVPPGWRDDTGWKKEVHVEYRVLTEGGRRFLRITHLKGGGAQFAHSLPGLEKEEGFYRLTLTARSPKGTGGSVGIRFIGAPYTTCWSSRPEIGPEWQEHSFEFRLGKQPQPVGFWIWIDEGTLDLQHLRLVKLSREEILAELRERYPAPAAKNRAHATRFPLGLPAGWLIGRDYSDGDEVTVVPDRELSGPSGFPALRIAAEKGIEITTAPFLVPPWSGKEHTASLAVRGRAQGKLVALADGRTLAEAPFTATDEWQRARVSFTAALFAKAHVVRIEATGTFWVDALQVEEGRETTAYTPPAPCEVSLALPPSDASPALVQFEDEPAVVLYCVTGEAPGAVLKARVINVYGVESPLPDVRLRQGKLHQGRMRYAIFPGRSYGTHRIEAWVEDATGRRLSPETELVVHRLRRPRYWGKDAPNSPFGIHTNATTRHILMAKAVGCNWVRLHDAGTQYIGWAHLEPEKGKWQFFDEPIHRYRKHRLMILGLLSTAPGWATDWGQPTKSYFERYFQPKKMEDWANAVRVITRRYQGVIDHWEIWNEPWGTLFWIGSYDREKTDKPFRERVIRSKTAAKDYAILQKTAYETARAEAPGARILGFNTMPGQWTRELLEHGAVESCDIISYHDYSGGTLGKPQDAPAKRYEEAIGPFVEKLGRVPRPVWMSEGNVLDCPLENGFYRWTLPYDAPSRVISAADRLARYLISQRALGVEKSFLYTIHGHGAFGVRYPWTALVSADGALHPQGAAHSTLAWLIEDMRFVKCLSPCEGVFAYLFSGRSRAVAALSPDVGHAPYTLPEAPGITCLDLFGNPLSGGTPLGTEVVYLTTSRGFEALEAALKQKPAGARR